MSEFPSEAVSPAVVANTEEQHSMKSKPSKCWTFGGLAVGLLLFQIVRPQIWGYDTPFPTWAEMLASGLWTAFSVGSGVFVGRLVEGATSAPPERALVLPRPPRTNTTASPAVIRATRSVPGPVQLATPDDFPSEAT